MDSLQVLLPFSLFYCTVIRVIRLIDCDSKAREMCPGSFNQSYKGEGSGGYVNWRDTELEGKSTGTGGGGGGGGGGGEGLELG